MIKPVKFKPKKCKACKETFVPVRPLMMVCSGPCAHEYVKRNTEKKRKLEESKENKAWKVKKKELKEKLKTKSDHEKDLQKEVNHIARLLDKGWPCISSGVEKYQENAGHMYSVGAFPSLRYNLLNIYNQSVGDNLYKSGNGVIYKERIKEVFGQEVSEEIETLKARYKELKLSIPELKETIKVARSCVRELINSTKESDKPYTITQRIELRRHYNQILNIYL